MANFSYDDNALNKFMDELNDLADKVENLNGETVEFDAIFNSEFMSQHTNVLTFDDFLKQGNYQIDNEDDLDLIADEYVRKNTDFSSWEDMYSTATGEYVEQQLGF